MPDDAPRCGGCYRSDLNGSWWCDNCDQWPCVCPIATAGALRRAIADVPDDTPILVHLPDDAAPDSVRELADAGIDGTCEGPMVLRLTVGEEP